MHLTQLRQGAKRTNCLGAQWLNTVGGPKIWELIPTNVGASNQQICGFTRHWDDWLSCGCFCLESLIDPPQLFVKKPSRLTHRSR